MIKNVGTQEFLHQSYNQKIHFTECDYGNKRVDCDNVRDKAKH